MSIMIKAEAAPDISQVKAILANVYGLDIMPSGGVHAIATRNRFVRVKKNDGGVLYFYYAVESDWPSKLQDASNLIRVTPVIAEPLFGVLPDCNPRQGEHEIVENTFAQGKQVLPYEYVTRDFDTITGYRLMLYGAYNAMGLIGSEGNGIVVADNMERQIVADELFKEASGWGGPSVTQTAMFRILARLLMEDQHGFAAVINHVGTGRLRTPVKGARG